MVELPIVKNNGLLRALGDLQVDVIAGLVILIGASMSVLYTDSTVVRAVFGIPLLVFLPGYAVLLVLFPHTYTDTRVARPALVTLNRTRTGITFVERMVLSFGISLALIPTLGILILSFVPQPTTVLVVGAFTTIIAAGLLAGEYRRQQLAETDRYDVPVKSWFTAVVESFTTGTARTRRLNVVLAAVVVLSVVGFGYALTVPNYGEEYTNLSLLTQQSDGEFVASGYPETLSSGETTELFASVTNNERELIQYTLVVQLQRVDTSDGSVSVIEYEELARVSQEVAPGETWAANPELTPEMTGSDLRLTYLLYKGDAPANPDTESAYRSTYIWVSN
ncbi:MULTISPECIES: DUF1616 domain-containing protein [Haloferax]|uniref:DUF1616 domain-containing protein n=2 Tax=Haloferax TaxID=2251 RepID=A0A6G1Z768_9EURY|nr:MULTISPECIES: DUF1616 domain-containing protein [Haloferax]KAB1185155.1 DUF1616 domain-containing protein [Haloferax sp. CBA1149]MRW82333.1 DUF1616 domain-containing protein [Haloferax marinisediminis]